MTSHVNITSAVTALLCYHKLFFKQLTSNKIKKFFFCYTFLANFNYSDPSLYRASPIAASLLRGIFYSAFFTVNPDWLRGFTVV